MRILFLGDVVGRSAREALIKETPRLRESLRLDCVIVNGENAAGGFGITAAIAEDFFAAGVDVITTGNHVWDQAEAAELLAREPRLLRPDNYPPRTPGRGGGVFKTRSGEAICVINLMGRLFMPIASDNPFDAAERWMARHILGRDVAAFVVDMHAESVSEKMAMGHFCDGRVSLVVGSHTHAPTSDERILLGGTAYMTDAGMCGNYDSVVGFEKEKSVRQWATAVPGGRKGSALGEASLCGVYVETDGRGLAVDVGALRLGGLLLPTLPSSR